MPGPTTDHELGDAAEGSLAESLRFLANGSCSAAAAARARAARAPRKHFTPDGWRQLLGAY